MGDQMLHKVALIAILAWVSISAASAKDRWFRVHEDGGDGIELFADTQTASRKGDSVKMWVLTNHDALKSGDRSQVNFREFDCAKQETRNLTARSFSKSGGYGDLVYMSDDAEKWHRVTPESAGELMLQFACAAVKRK
jgi:hypothetical protein